MSTRTEHHVRSRPDAAARGRASGLLWPGTAHSLHPAASVAVAGILLALIGGLLLRGSTAEFGAVLTLNGIRIPGADGLSETVGTGLGPASAIGIGVTFAVFVSTWSRSVATAVAAALAVGLSWGGVGVLKLIVARPRPDWQSLPQHLGVAETDPSYPSAHVAFIGALSTACVLLAWRTRARWWVLAAGAAATVTVALARLHAGVHYPSDVVAGALCGACGVILAFVLVDLVDARTGLSARVDDLLPLARRA
ncbi:phosphatase PAP2 family protein [Microbacterium sp. NPDC057659]|uniref:phosphatase PAP2 family protein n=1 Tax=Microbacterium sp. NPDC057659 TaxID=3346198 RepID=UPI00366B6991